VPEDVTGLDTYDIVRQIRCETRDALRREVVTWLDDLGRDHPHQRASPIARRLADEYESNPESFSNFSTRLFPGPDYVHVRSTINLFANAGIAYNFDLTMTEDNDLTTDVNFIRPLTRPKFTLGINAGLTRKRSNQRSFTVTDTFSYLVAKLNTPVRGRYYCEPRLVAENYIYPIAGRIGVDKLVHDFVQLTLFGGLAGKQANPGEGGAPTMADKLTFTTTVSASASPKVEFAPIGHGLQLANASLSAKADRIDVHQVTVALAIDKTGMAGLDPFRSYLFSTERGGGTTSRQIGGRTSGAGPLIVGRRVTGGGTPSERLAVIAIDQLKSRELELVTAP